MPIISFYKNVKQIESKDTLPFDLFLEAIRSGKWQDDVFKVRLIQDKDQRRAAKALMPNVTISGQFGKREDKDCKLHSGYIGIDIDDLGNEVEATKQLLSQDPYVSACFVSIGGLGLCTVIKIDPEKHREAFEGIADYLIKKYQLIVDPTGINPSRTRFVSYDPYIYINEKALTFKKYLPKPKVRKVTATIFVQDEFDRVISELTKASVSCVEDYRDWRDIAFGLADQFGEAGRGYFHSLSSCSPKYEASMCDRQYTHALKRNGRGGNKITIATIYWHAKQAGINVASERTKRIAAATSTLKKAGLNAESIAESLKRHEGITGAEDVIKQAFAANASFAEGESLVENIRMWLRHNFQLKRNVVTRKLENSGKILDEIDLNTMFLDCKILFDQVTFDLFCKVLFSANTPQYNPLTDWFEERKEQQPVGYITAIFDSFSTNGDYLHYFGTKWLVSIIASVYGEHSPLMLIFAGERQGSGKTEAFRRLLPIELKSYYAEISPGMKDTDFNIMLTQNLIVMDDECGGKSKNDAKHLKSILSKQVFTLREPYGKMNVDLRRLAVLCGTTNDLAILNDPTGNRRLLPMEILSIDFAKYNSVDKEQLFIEAYQLFKSGFDWTLAGDDMVKLSSTAGRFEDYSMEYELIQKYFMYPKGALTSDLSSSEIKIILENKSLQRSLSLKRIGMELKRLGYVSKISKVAGKVKRTYAIVEYTRADDDVDIPEPDLPF